MSDPTEICAKCGYTYDGHVGNTGCLFPCWTPSGRFKSVAASSLPSREATPPSLRSEPFTREEDERAALALVPLAKEIADFVRSKIPDGTDFGVLLFAKPPAGHQEGRVIALTSDRERVSRYAATWALNVMAPEVKQKLDEKIRGGT